MINYYKKKIPDGGATPGTGRRLCPNLGHVHMANEFRWFATPPENLVAKLRGSLGMRVSCRDTAGWKSGVVK